MIPFTELITNPIFLFFIGFLGMITHFLKKYEKDELNTAVNGRLHNMYIYFIEKNIVNTIYSFISYIVLFIITYQMGDLSILSMFGAGYMSDSLFNRLENK